MSRRTRLIWRSIVAALAAGAAVFAAVLLWPVAAVREVAAPQVNAELVAQGSYLAGAADCVACHTVEGGEPYAGGRAFKLPFGIIYAPNITPDRDTGIGAWSDGEFLRALHKGIGRDGEQLYPAFPYASYARMSDADALAIKAYLFSLAPVHRVVPDNKLTFPFRYRRLVRFWNIMFVPATDGSRESVSPQWQRGEYLVNVLGHCGECHTPRNLLYGLSNSALAGETLQGWTAWNITSDVRHGIGAWSDQELTAYLRSGYTPRRGVASGPMKEAVDHSLSKLTDEDLASIVAYLRTVLGVERGPVVEKTAAAARSNFVLPAEFGEPIDQWGRQIFAGACIGCHAWNGEGQNVDIAALNGRRSVFEADGNNVLQVILNGAEMVTANSTAFMPDFRRSYSDAELAALANYTLQHFGGTRSQISAEQVARARMQ